MGVTADSGQTADFGTADGGYIPLSKQLDVYDHGNGTVDLAWGNPQDVVQPPPDGFNVYVDGVFNQYTTSFRVTVSGLTGGASYNSSTGVVTPPAVHDFKVVAVKGGVETAATLDAKVTMQPTSVNLVTPMHRPFPFPNTAPGG